MEGRRIKGLRMHLELSQEGFARHIGVSLQTVRRWEGGLTKPLPIISLKLDEMERQAGVTKRGAGETMKSEARQDREARAELGLGGLFKGIGSLVDLVGRMAAEGKEEETRTGEVEAAGGRLKGVYGFSVRTGLGGKPVIEQFGNLQETESGPVVVENREPLMDVFDEGERVLVIAELPGIEEKDVRMSVNGDILDVAASTRDRKYHKEVLLPESVDPESLESSYRNGVLEIRLAKE